MLLITHITVALLSIAQATFALVSPSKAKLRATYGLVVATLATGTYLVWQLHSPLLQSCETGLGYLAVVSVLGALARYRLMRAPVKIR